MALLTRAALDALCLLLGASGGGARRPFGGAHAAALAEQLDTVLEMGGGAAIGRALAAGASDEALVFHGLRVLCALTRPVSGLPEGSQDHPQARAERVTSDGTLGAALLALAAQRASARVQLVGVLSVSSARCARAASRSAVEVHGERRTCAMVEALALPSLRSGITQTRATWPWRHPGPSTGFVWVRHRRHVREGGAPWWKVLWSHSSACCAHTGSGCAM